jgi:hypothetical protein
MLSLRMLNNLWLADLRLTTAQQRFTGQNLPFDLYIVTIVLYSGTLGFLKIVCDECV